MHILFFPSGSLCRLPRNSALLPGFFIGKDNNCHPTVGNSKLTVCTKSIILALYPYKWIIFYCMRLLVTCFRTAQGRTLFMEGTRPSTVNSIGMFDMLKGMA